VNVPAGAVAGIEVTALGQRVYRDLVDVRQDLRGRSYYWIGGPELEVDDLPGSDMHAVRAGRASVTPLGLDLSHRGLMADLRNWALDGALSPES
jgi:5'-nucleotidase